jgi:hypothetical protein
LDEEPAEHCGLSGCIQPVTEDPLHAGYGVPLLIGGAAMGTAGVATLLIGLTREPRPLSNAQVRLAAGTWALAYGAGSAGFGVGLSLMVDELDGRDMRYPFLVAGGVFGALGVGLTASVLADDHDDTPRRSEARMYTGVALTSLGVATLGSGVMTFAVIADARGDEVGLDLVRYGLPLLIGGSGLIAAGIPLWIVGSLPDEDAALDLELDGGPGGLQLRGKF